MTWSEPGYVGKSFWKICNTQGNVLLKYSGHPDLFSNFSCFSTYFNILISSFSRGGSLRIKRHIRSPSTSSFAFGEFERLQNQIMHHSTTEWYINTPEIQPSSYMEYLRDAHRNVRLCTLACRSWSAAYDGIDPGPNAVIDTEFKEEFNQVKVIEQGKGSLLQKAQQPQNSVLELSTENVAVLQDSLNQTHQDTPKTAEIQKDFVTKHNEAIPSEILQQIVSTDDDKEFWNLVGSTNTPSDLADSLQAIDEYLSDFSLVGTEDKIHLSYTENVDSKDECSNAEDSGVFESRDSCISERDALLNALSAKSSDHKDSLFISIPSCPPKSDLKTSSSVSETSTKSNSPASPGSWETFSSPNIGPFLSIILTRLEMMMQNDVYTNLHLTGIISRLACYPQPLIRSFLLNPSLVFQPTVRSLFQV